MAFFEFDRVCSLIDVTDKFLFDLKGEGIGLQTLCFDRKNQAGIVPQQVILERLHIKNDKLERNLQNLAALLPLNKVEEVRLVLKHFLMLNIWWAKLLNYYEIILMWH